MRHDHPDAQLARALLAAAMRTADRSRPRDRAVLAARLQRYAATVRGEAGRNIIPPSARDRFPPLSPGAA